MDAWRPEGLRHNSVCNSESESVLSWLRYCGKLDTFLLLRPILTQPLGWQNYLKTGLLHVKALEHALYEDHTVLL
jgi:hypothetical protein